MLVCSRSQAGDTIVEVMIALAVIGAVIGTSYAISARSLRLGRQAQERTEALKLVESQVELIKTAAQGKNTAIFTSSSDFCLTTTAAGVTLSQNGAVPADFITDSLTTNNNLTGGSYSVACSQGVASRYKLSMKRVDVDTVVVGVLTPVKTSTFTIRARWDKIGGGKDEVSIDYRLHRGLYQ